jgi:hypothetical protein
MKRVSVLLLFISVHIIFAVTASADPRMETNDNFCHFILNAENTDNEVFLAGCDSVITVVEKVAGAEGVTAKCEENNYMASGYAAVTKTVPQAAAPIPPGTTRKFTSTDTDTPCTMVESNGRQYRSQKWQSTIRVSAAVRKNPVVVYYEIICQEGVQ